MSSVPRTLLAHKTDLGLPGTLRPGKYAFPAVLGTLRMRVAFAMYGHDYEISETDIGRLADARDVQLDFDNIDRLWRFTWSPLA